MTKENSSPEFQAMIADFLDLQDIDDEALDLDASTYELTLLSGQSIEIHEQKEQETPHHWVFITAYLGPCPMDSPLLAELLLLNCQGLQQNPHLTTFIAPDCKAYAVIRLLIEEASPEKLTEFIERLLIVCEWFLNFSPETQTQQGNIPSNQQIV